MATTTPTRTLADVYRERLAAAGATDRFGSAMYDAICAMAPYQSETGDLRKSEVEWLDKVFTAALDAAEEASIAATASVFERELPRLLDRDDGMAPPDLWAQGGDAISEDAELAAGRTER